ncbi:MAG TPA: hypothetical protein VFU02_24295 [Polyangiaceae bacterium]|nr:hypothetical protein [Polyangiaceae bacterium]
MANPISRGTEDKRESGFQRTGAGGAGTGVAPAVELPAPEPLLGRERLEAAIQAHNQELAERAGSLFELPLVVLTEQRDHALRRLATAQERAADQRRRWVAEQDEFISFLMSEHEVKLRELRADYERIQNELAATRSAAPSAAGAIAVTELAWDEPELHELQQALAAANAEIDETRADAQRLQEERDDAIRATDDVRLELLSELESARDETFQLETRLDEAHRLLEDARDQARDEVLRLTEELADLRAELDTRNGEIQRLRTRLVAHTVPATRDAAARRADLARRRQ